MLPTFQFDPVKSLNNFAKHGMDFNAVQEVWNDAYMRRLPAKFSEGQVRWAYTGTIGKKVYMVIVQELSTELFRIIAAYEAHGIFLKDYKQHKGVCL
jgi:uncharacterized DUF497 family protein